jgi:2-phospho-L-lactate transferase/gluconeogenesis factor (CofD/UPF0052 family)
VTPPTLGSAAPGHGPRVVAIGGGHGQAATLRAARHYAGTLTAVVSVADDGGSSGRLRRDLGMVPPGDLRTCLVALAGEGSLLAAAFEHRFPEALVPPVADGGAGAGSAGASGGGGAGAGGGGAGGAAAGARGPGAEAAGGLLASRDPANRRGHALGNLVLAGLLAVTGDVQVAVDEAAALLQAAGRVVPVSYEPVVLAAESAGGAVEGQTAVMHTARIRRMTLRPADPPAAPAAVAAIAAADQVILGPGSLYTSVLAAAMVPGVAAALRATGARRVYVCNLRPQAAETEGYDVSDHVAALAAHGIPVDVVLCDTTGIELGSPGVPVVQRPLAKASGLAHDPAQLAKALADLVG